MKEAVFYRYYHVWRPDIDETKARRCNPRFKRDDISLMVRVENEEFYSVCFAFLHPKEARKGNRKVVKAILKEKFSRGEYVLVSKKLVAMCNIFHAFNMSLLVDDIPMPKWYNDFLKTRYDLFQERSFI